MLDTIQHGIRLPPGDVVIVVKICQIVSGMGEVRDAGVANIARFLRSFGSSLCTKFTRTVETASIGRFNPSVESCVHEIRYASLEKIEKITNCSINQKNAHENGPFSAAMITLNSI